VFKLHCKGVSRDGASLTLAGRLLHAWDATTGNARSPSDNWRVDGTSNVGVAAERRQQRPATIDVGGSVKRLG